MFTMSQPLGKILYTLLILAALQSKQRSFLSETKKLSFRKIKG